MQGGSYFSCKKKGKKQPSYEGIIEGNVQGGSDFSCKKQYSYEVTLKDRVYCEKIFIEQE